MADACVCARVPATVQLVAGYLHGACAWSAADWARFPGKPLVRIEGTAANDDGDVLDVESSDATPAQAPGWVAMRRRSGADPTVYMSAANWGAVRAAFAHAGIAEPHYWVAQWDGIPTLPAGAVAKQYRANISPGYDLSVVADFWPGIDSAPAPGPAPAPPSWWWYQHGRFA